MTGCQTTAQKAPGTPFTVIMKSLDVFIVNDKAVDAAHLVTVLNKNKVSRSEPLIIEIPANTSFESLKIVTQKLASAGYKPFFKNPRHANSSSGDSRRNTGTRMLYP